MSKQALLIVACIICAGCPREPQPRDDAADDGTTAAPEGDSAATPTTTATPEPAAADQTCEDKLADVEAKLKACEDPTK